MAEALRDEKGRSIPGTLAEAASELASSPNHGPQRSRARHPTPLPVSKNLCLSRVWLARLKLSISDDQVNCCQIRCSWLCPARSLSVTIHA